MTMPMTAQPIPTREPHMQTLSLARIARLARLLMAARAAAAGEMAPHHAREALARIDCFLADHLLPALAAFEPLAESNQRQPQDLRRDPATFFCGDCPLCELMKESGVIVFDESVIDGEDT